MSAMACPSGPGPGTPPSSWPRRITLASWAPAATTASGLRVNPGGRLRIHSTDPAKAKLLIRGIGSANDDLNALSLNLSPSDYDGARWKSLPNRIDVVLLGDVVL